MAANFTILTSNPTSRIFGVIVNATLQMSFFVSGCSALIYQVCWQRLLYAVMGVDIDSVTIIVSVFMLGIGVGAMLGGWLADRYPRHRLGLYAMVELSIAMYGVATLWLVPWLGAVMVNAAWGSASATAMISFIFLIVPTTLMGMTLPVLTMLFNERLVNIGQSVGALYFVNTMGAALGAVLVPFILLPAFTLSQTVVIAVLGNLIVASCAVLVASRMTSAKVTIE